MASQATSRDNDPAEATSGLPEAVAALLRTGRREAAEQHLLRRWPKLSATAQTAWARQMAQACRDAGDAVRARRWLRRMPRSAGPADALQAAERMRLPRGRQGSWQRHLALLARARDLLAGLSRSAGDPDISETARSAAQRAATLLGVKAPPA